MRSISTNEEPRSIAGCSDQKETAVKLNSISKRYEMGHIREVNENETGQQSPRRGGLGWGDLAKACAL